MEKNVAAMSQSDSSTACRRDLPEYLTEIVVVIISLGLFAFIKLSGEVTNGETTGFDRQLLLMMRNPADLAEPVDPCSVRLFPVAAQAPHVALRVACNCRGLTLQQSAQGIL